MSKREAILISEDKSLLQIETICEFLKKTNWASKRPKKVIARSIESSLCFGAYSEGRQVAFARVVTDGCTFAYLCDVYVDEAFRGKGLSKLLLNKIVAHPELQRLRRFCLVTEDAHGLYEQFGFKNVPANKFMELMNDDV